MVVLLWKMTSHQQAADFIEIQPPQNIWVGWKRAAFQKEIEELKKEVNKTKGQNYDLLKKIEEQDNGVG